MNIAKIAGSNSHFDYVGRVIDDANDSPSADDHGFGQFVTISLEPEEIVGVIYDSRFENSENSNFGPRLGPRPAFTNLHRDSSDSNGILIGILLLGSIQSNGIVEHVFPRRVVPAGSAVSKMKHEDFLRFHRTENGALQMHYFSHIAGMSGQFAMPLISSAIGRLEPDCSEAERKSLTVLKQSLEWQDTFSNFRF